MSNQYVYPDPIQVDPDTVVTRQIGIDPKQLVGTDPVALPEIVQGGLPDMVTTRQDGNGHSFFDAAGVLHADHPAPLNTVFSDGPFASAEAIIVADSPISRDTDAGYPGHPGVVPGIPTGALVAWAKPEMAPAHAIGVPPRATSFEGDVAQTDQPSDVVRADQPLPGQQVEGAPQIITAAQVSAAQAARPPAPQIMLPSEDPAPARVKRAKKARK